MPCCALRDERAAHHNVDPSENIFNTKKSSDGRNRIVLLPFVPGRPWASASAEKAVLVALRLTEALTARVYDP
jgi:hypothetical protein